MNRFAKITSTVISLALFVAGIALAQTFQASVSGIVSDPTGAVVPNVKVTVTDAANAPGSSTKKVTVLLL